MAIFDNVELHLRRVPNWRLRDIELSLEETKALSSNAVDNHLMQKYLAWRRTVMAVSLPSLLFAAIFAYIGVASINYSAFNFLGVLTVLMPIIAPSISFVTVSLGLYSWTKYERSSRIVFYGWLASLVLPMWPALLPIDYLIDSEYKANVDDSLRLLLGIGYTLQLVPLLVTVPGGLLRGSLRIRGLLPESSLAGWFIIIVAPLQPLMIFAVLVLLSQLFGDMLLLIGTILLLTAPLLYSFNGRLYTGNLTPEQDVELLWVQRIMGLMSLLGMVLIASWALTEDFLPTSDVCRFIFVWIGSVLTTTIVFSDIVFRVTVHQLRVDRERQEEGLYTTEVDGLLASLFDPDADEDPEVDEDAEVASK